MGKDKDVENKRRWHLLPLEELEEVMKVIEFGADKYVPNGWKESKNPMEFWDALIRHAVKWRKNNYDKESGLLLHVHYLYYIIKGIQNL
jgi:hypothetical protein